VAWSTASAFAYTQEDTSACMSDAFRLCSASIPDAGEVARCLYAKRRHLSRPCAAAFARYGQQSARRHQQVSRD
jgi:hypothetical protein